MTPDGTDRTVVRVRGLTKTYGDFTALDDVGFDLRENVVTGLLGRNGAGKSTIMRILTGQAFEDAGEVRVFGQHPYENDDVLQRICFVSENLKYPSILRVRHVLEAAALLYPQWDQEFADRLVDEFDLPRKRYVSKLSRGQLSAVGIVLGLAARAPLTLFDEPYLGLDATARQLFYDRLLEDYAEHPRTVVLSTHLIDEVADLIEHVVLIDRGRIVIDEEAESLRGRAITITGPADGVERFVTGREVLHRDRLGSFSRVTVVGTFDGADREDARAAGLDLEPVSLQQLVVRTTQRGESTGTENGPQARSLDDAGAADAAGAAKGGAR